jgi:hypothetical protein
MRKRTQSVLQAQAMGKEVVAISVFPGYLTVQLEGNPNPSALGAYNNVGVACGV